MTHARLRDLVYDWIKQRPDTATAIARSYGVDAGPVVRAAEALVRDGRLQRLTPGRYALPS